MKRKTKNGIKLLTSLSEKMSCLDIQSKSDIFTYRAYGYMTLHQFHVQIIYIYIYIESVEGFPKGRHN